MIRVSKRSKNKQDIETLLVRTIGDAGAGGITISAIEALVDYDRHTLAKYLLVLGEKGVISCRLIGKAKVWSINTAPLSAVFSSLNAPKSFIEKVLSAVMHSVPQGLVITDTTYQIMYANDVARALCPQATHVYNLFNMQNPVRLTKLVDVLHNNVQEARQSLLTTDNKWYSLAISACPAANQRAAVILIDDITQQKSAQQTIADQAALLFAERRALNAATIIAETDPRGIITYVNKKFCDISGYTAKELLGKTHAVVNSGHHNKQFWSALWKTISAGHVWQGEIKNKRKNGSYYWVDSVIAPVLDEKSRPIKYIAIRYDITAYKMAQKRGKDA